MDHCPFSSPTTQHQLMEQAVLDAGGVFTQPLTWAPAMGFNIT